MDWNFADILSTSEYGQSSLENYKAAKEFYSNLTYKQFRKPNSDIKLKANVWTDSSGNYVSQENLIHIPYVDMLDLSVDFEWTKEALENEVEYSDAVDTNFEATPIYESIPGAKTSVAAQEEQANTKELPSTGETTSALGLMGLAMAALGFVGLKRKRESR